MTLYETDFENFTVGQNRLVGSGGWLGASTGTTNGWTGVQGIDQDVEPGVGRSAFLGYYRPPLNTTFVSVYRPVTYAPLTTGNPIVTFYTVFGIADSTNGFRDNFYISFYNQQRQLLAALNFDNTAAGYGTYRMEGSAYHSTSSTFQRDNLAELTVTINCETNRWTAQIGAVPLFEDQVFNATGLARTLGNVAVEWEITAAAFPGNNWMLFDDFTVTVQPASTPAVTSLTRKTDGTADLSWPVEPGYNYQVQYSPNLVDWFTDLPNSVKMAIPAGTEAVSFTDSTLVGTPPAKRYYRLVRTVPASP